MKIKNFSIEHILKQISLPKKFGHRNLVFFIQTPDSEFFQPTFQLHASNFHFIISSLHKIFPKNAQPTIFHIFMSF